MQRVYLDHNATTPMRREARELFHELCAETGNASSVHHSGRRARARVDEARERVAAALGVHEEEVVFTSGGTEANNLALFGALAEAPPGTPGSGLVTTAVEHSSVLEPAARLETLGHGVVVVGVDAQARPDLGALAAAAQDPATGLVSVMGANNEVGTLGPVRALAEHLAGLDPCQRPLLHSDMTQAVGRIPVDLRDFSVDLASASFHKLGGPYGAGLLFGRRGVRVAPRVVGGGQEDALRAGTENVPAIAAGALALELAVSEQVQYAEHTRALASALCEEVERTLPGARTLGLPWSSTDRLPNTVALSLAGVDGRVLVARLDLLGLEASAGSACSSGALEPSHVLLAMGLSREEARSGLRLSFGRSSSVEDARRAVDILRKALQPR